MLVHVGVLIWVKHASASCKLKTALHALTYIFVTTNVRFCVWLFM